MKTDMKKLQITLIVCSLLCAVSILVSTVIISSLAGRLDSQTAYERWSADGTAMAQLSAFISPEAGLTSNAVEHSFTSALDSALVNASISPASEDSRIYAFAYSAEGSVTMSRTGEFGKTLKGGVSARVVACGADYFLFHPQKMLSGWYFSTTDILNDCVVIDNDLAWQFFGSADVVGQMLKINGRECYISGVCENGESGDYAEFYGDVPRIFVPYSFAEELLGSLSVTVVELTSPNPVGGFAMEMFKGALPANEALCEYVENSERFEDEYLRGRLLGTASRGVRTKPVAYPYYENTAIKLQDRAANVYIFKLIPTVLLVLVAAFEIILVYIKRKAIIGAMLARISRFVRDRRQNKRHRAAKINQKGEDLT